LKQFWIQIDSKAPEKEKLLKFAAEVGDAVVENSVATIVSSKQVISVLDGFNEGLIKNMKHEGKTIALKITLKGKQDENNAVKAAELSADYIIINCLDWRVIPLENLIARTRGKSVLIAEVSNAPDAKLVLEALELGTDGILLTTSDVCEIEKTVAVVKPLALKIGLVSAKIVTVAPIDTGARVCVDTCDLMAPGEGILEAEVHENPYVAARPFRVNAGSISMYTLGSMQNTRYLSELKAGDEIIITTRDGKVRKANVGRVKIEYRPLMLIEAEVSGKKIKTILQNAETIRMVTPKGSTPVTELKAGDKVLVYVAAKGGRHFGVTVAEETVIER
jgi:3-dehydroquinate synthase II